MFTILQQYFFLKYILFWIIKISIKFIAKHLMGSFDIWL